MTGTNGMNTIWRKVHPRHVIWFLFTSLITVLVFIGYQYHSRLEAIEDGRKEQNGHLKEISTEVKHIGETVGEIRTEQKEMKVEQTKMKIDLEVIKQKVEDQ